MGRVRAFAETASPGPVPAATHGPRPAAKKTAPATLYAGVIQRRPDGAVTELVLPAPLASTRVPYLIHAGGPHWMQAGTVARDGTVSGGMGLGQPNPTPSERLLCVADPHGRVLCVQQVPARRK